MAEILELTDQEFNTTMIKMLMALLNKVDSHLSREMESPRENKKEMLEIKNIVTEMKNAIDVLTGHSWEKTLWASQ